MINFFEFFSIIIIFVSLMGVIISRNKLELISYLTIMIFATVLFIADTIKTGDLVHFFVLPTVVQFLFVVLNFFLAILLRFLEQRRLKETFSYTILFVSAVQLLILSGIVK